MPKALAFDELSPAAKKNALKTYRDLEADSDWWLDVYEDAQLAGEVLGITIMTATRRNVHKRAHEELYIQFSGFWSQGDGCCFTGYVRVKDLIENGNIRSFNDPDILAISEKGRELYDAIAVVQAVERLDPDNEEYPECRTDMSIEVIGNARGGFSTSMRHYDLVPDNVRKLIEEFVEAFASWIYKELQTEYEYITGDDHITEVLLANEARFTEDGEII